MGLTQHTFKHQFFGHVREIEVQALHGFGFLWHRAGYYTMHTIQEARDLAAKEIRELRRIGFRRTGSLVVRFANDD